MASTPPSSSDLAIKPVMPEPRGRVLPVRDHKIEAMLDPQARHAIQHDVTPRAPDNVTDEQQFQHGAERADEIRPRQRQML
jgi:hypothetical protein